VLASRALTMPRSQNIKESDTNFLKNPKVFFLILMFAMESKDDLYYFLVRISKKHGIYFL
jgi:hypothetical protein